jgi:prevent-host-death family protein
VTTLYGHEQIAMKISAAEFKARCLKLMDEVAKTREPVVITKRGKAIAQLAPVKQEPENLFGCMAGTVTFVGDMMAPLGVQWAVETGEEDHLYASPARRRNRHGSKRRK